jgi:PucR family transcriptional regulator, purine catabolism regulatory protein
LYVVDKMTSPTLRTLLADRSLGLTLLTGESLDVPIRWVATSELEDPTPFLLGGELLLTTGISLPKGARAAERYVGRLVDAGVVGLGFGVGLGYQRVPRALVAGAARLGLPVIEVDRPTPFIAISKTVSDLLAQEQYAGVTQGFRGQQQLTRAAVRGGVAGVAAKLAALLEGWTLVLDSTGGVRVARPRSAARRSHAIARHLEPLRGRRPAAVSVVELDEHMVIEPLGTAGHVRGFLALGTRRALTPTDRAVVHVASALLSFALERGRSDEAERAARAAVWRLALRGVVDLGPDELADLGVPVLARDSMTVVLVDARTSDGDGFRRQLEDVAGSNWLVADHDGQVVVVVGRPRDVAQVESIVTASDGCCLGASAEVPRDRLRAALDQARAALASARSSGRTAIRFEDLTHAGVVDLADPVAARAYAAAMLAPLDDYREARGIDLTRTLRVWLRHHGQYDPAAAELGIHRHTLRYRVRKAEALLERGLDDVTARMDLWFALEARDRSTRYPA